MTSNRATDMTRNGMSSLYCAEAGLAAARGTVAANYPLWNAALAFQVANPGVEPPFLNTGQSPDRRRRPLRITCSPSPTIRTRLHRRTTRRSTTTSGSS